MNGIYDYITLLLKSHIKNIVAVMYGSHIVLNKKKDMCILVIKI